MKIRIATILGLVLLIGPVTILAADNPDLLFAQQSGINYQKFCQEYSKQSKDFQTKYRGVYLKNCLKLNQPVAVPPKKEQGKAVPPAQQAPDQKKDEVKPPKGQPDVIPVKKRSAPTPQQPEIKPAEKKEPKIKRPIPVLRPTLPETKKGPLPVVKTNKDQKQAAADLAIASFKTPASAKAGEDISKKIKLSIENRGSGSAPGTQSSRTKGYTVYLVLSRDQSVPVNVAASAGKFKEDLLLKDGSAVKTQALEPGGQFRFPTAKIVIPNDTPAGNYYLCARIDPWNRVKETDEKNNLSCRSIRITGAPNVALTESDVPGVEIPREERQPSIPVLPADRQLLDYRLENTLRLNGDALGPVTVRIGDEATVSWELPAENEADGIYLRITNDSRRTWCSDTVAGHGLPGSGHFTGAPSGAQSIRFNDAEAYPAPHPPRPYNRYYMLGCLWRDGGYTGEYTNTVEFHLESAFVASEELVSPVPPETVLPDLYFRHVQLIRSGADRNRLSIRVGVDFPRGYEPPGGTFPYLVFLFRPETWTGSGLHNLRNGLSAALGDPHAGVGQVRDLGFNRYGDNIVTDFALPDDRTYIVLVTMNLEGESRYTEHNYRNNIAVRMLGLTADTSESDVILDLWPEREGPGWALITVLYALQSRSSGVMSLQLFPDADDIGESPVAGQDFISCTTDQGSRYEPARQGVNRRASFLCRRSESSGSYLERARVRLESGAGTGELARAFFPFYRNWREEGSTPILPDLVGDFNALTTASNRFAGEVVVIVSNQGSLRARNTTEALFQIRSTHSGSGAVLYEQPITVSRLQPGTREVNRILIPSHINIDGASARLVVDYGGALFETDESNNSVTGPMPAPAD
jgi:hypothetical protein